MRCFRPISVALSIPALFLVLLGGCVPLPIPIIAGLPVGGQEAPVDNSPGPDGNPSQLSGGCLGLGEPRSQIHEDALAELNDYRTAHGLSALEYSVYLEQAADDHARDMYVRGFFDHINPDGDSPGDRAEAAGFCHPYGGENIAFGMNRYSTASSVTDSWKTSPGHNANMLRSGFAYVGIGYYHIQEGNNNYYYWVQLFAFDQ